MEIWASEATQVSKFHLRISYRKLMVNPLAKAHITLGACLKTSRTTASSSIDLSKEIWAWIWTNRCRFRRIRSTATTETWWVIRGSNAHPRRHLFCKAKAWTALQTQLYWTLNLRKTAINKPQSKQIFSVSAARNWNQLWSAPSISFRITSNTWVSRTTLSQSWSGRRIKLKSTYSKSNQWGE